VQVERFKELEIVDDAVIGDTRASNAAKGAWSFRHAMEEMAPAGTDPSEFVHRWFEEWNTVSKHNGFPIPDKAQLEAGGTAAIFASGMERLVLCPWKKRTPANGCNADCSVCTDHKLDLAVAPLRLIAIANRMDLRIEPDILAAGEGRLVYAVTTGAADDPSSAPMPMTIILEYKLPDSVAVGDWARAWHSLGKHTAFDEGYKNELQSVTDRFVSRNAIPGVPNGSALHQARTNGNAIFWGWQMRQFGLGSDGLMHPQGVRNTPDVSMNKSPILAAWLNDNAEVVKTGHYAIPESFLGATTDNLLFKWSVPNVDRAVETEFARGTCNGCHSEGVNPFIDLAFQISPFRSGTEKLSAFINNPADPTKDDLAVRTRLLQDALCTP
jgi:hypothetical protein